VRHEKLSAEKRRQLVAAVRKGQSQRQVARQYRVRLRVVQYWLARAHGRPLAQVDWADRPPVPRRPPHRLAPAIERRILACRRALQQGALGFVGAQAIAEALREELGERLPSVRTIGRVLLRQGVLDGRRRQRRPSPPPGWHLPDVAAGRATLDAFDFIEDLCLEGGKWFDVLTTRALGGPECGAWVGSGSGTTAQVLAALPEHWRDQGLPTYAQFDNDRRFHGPHRHPDTLGRVVRLCLQLGVTPVFAPLREHGLQNGIESFNHWWQAKVWHRFEHAHRAALVRRSERFVEALMARQARRRDVRPARRAFPRRWKFDPQARLRGQVIFIRRLDEQGRLSLLGHTWELDPALSLIHI
jgi:putative transposase